jgi:hypothetical protein
VRNVAGVSSYLLHKMRKTFVSTLQRYLRHSAVSTIIGFVADQPDDQVREAINSAFIAFELVVGAT